MAYSKGSKNGGPALDLVCTESRTGETNAVQMTWNTVVERMTGEPLEEPSQEVLRFNGVLMLNSQIYSKLETGIRLLGWTYRSSDVSVCWRIKDGFIHRGRYSKAELIESHLHLDQPCPAFRLCIPGDSGQTVVTY